MPVQLAVEHRATPLGFVKPLLQSTVRRYHGRGREPEGHPVRQILPLDRFHAYATRAVHIRQAWARYQEVEFQMESHSVGIRLQPRLIENQSAWPYMNPS